MSGCRGERLKNGGGAHKNYLAATTAPNKKTLFSSEYIVTILVVFLVLYSLACNTSYTKVASLLFSGYALAEASDFSIFCAIGFVCSFLSADDDFPCSSRIQSIRMAETWMVVKR